MATKWYWARGEGSVQRVVVILACCDAKSRESDWGNRLSPNFSEAHGSNGFQVVGLDYRGGP